jgi:hypothetical protein
MMIDGVTSTVGYRTTDFTFTYTNATLSAGEIISMKVVTSTGWIRSLSIESPPGQVISGPVAMASTVGAAGTVSYTIPQDGLYNLYFVVDVDATDGAAFKYTFQCTAAPLPPPPPDSRFNWHHGGMHSVVMYAADESGTPGLRMLSPRGRELLWLPLAALNPDSAPPAVNTELARTPDGQIRVYRLATGEFQVNIGPDAAGIERVTIFEGIPPARIYSSEWSIYDAP